MNAKIIFAATFSVTSLLISGCAGVEIKKSPSGYGSEAGDYFIQEWNKTSKTTGTKYPSSDFAGAYCGNLAYDIGTKEGWSLSQQTDFSDACTDSIIKGLGL